MKVDDKAKINLEHSLLEAQKILNHMQRESHFEFIHMQNIQQYFIIFQRVKITRELGILFSTN